MKDWIKRWIPKAFKDAARLGQFLLVYFRCASPASTEETSSDRVLAAILSVRRDLEQHTCTVEPPPDTVPFLQRLLRIYGQQKSHQPAPPYRTGKIWEEALRKWRRNYLAALESGDAERLRDILRCFHRNDTINSIGIEVEIFK